MSYKFNKIEQKTEIGVLFSKNSFFLLNSPILLFFPYKRRQKHFRHNHYLYNLYTIWHVILVIKPKIWIILENFSLIFFVREISDKLYVLYTQFCMNTSLFILYPQNCR